MGYIMGIAIEREMGDELLVCCAFVVSIRRICSGELRKTVA